MPQLPYLSWPWMMLPSVACSPTTHGGTCLLRSVDFANEDNVQLNVLEAMHRIEIN